MRTAGKAGAVAAAAALCGSVVTIAVRGTPAPAAPSPPALGTALVTRTDLSQTVLTAGALGYGASPPVVNRLGGTFTSLLAAGSVVASGQVLYRVDNQPVVLMVGATPAWRPFAPGMADGPDVQELEGNLIALGDAAGLLATASTHFGPGAAAAVERWQASLGYPATGSIDFGEVVFLPAPVRVGSVSAVAGQAASPGDTPYQVTTTSRIVSVPLTPDDPSAAIGQEVSIVLPSGPTTPGRVTAVGPAPPAGAGGTSSGSSSGSSSNSSSSSSSSSSPPPTTVLTVTPDDLVATGTSDGESVQVSLTVQSVQHVLAVPVAALLALAGGGYGLEVAEPSGHHVVVAVRTGVFAGGEVEVNGAGIAAGDRVVVAQ